MSTEKAKGDADDEDWSDLDDSALALIDENNFTCLNSCDEMSGQVLTPSSSREDYQIFEQKPKGPTSEIPRSPSSQCDAAQPPLIQFTRFRYLTVTDITQQLWCEQQLQYRLMGAEPGLTDRQECVTGEVPLRTEDKQEVKKGKSLHYARELEVHDVVDIKISTNVDKWALSILNLLTAMRGFLAGITKAREVPIFGDPFGTGDMLFGIIDELQFDEDTYSLHLLELKTRKSMRLPGVAQARQNAFQVQMYKRLWDNLVSGDLSVEFFLSKLSLEKSADLPLGKDIVKFMDQLTLSTYTLRNLFSMLISTAQCLVCINSMSIEYLHQETQHLIGRVEVKEDDDWLWRTFQNCMKFWHGLRQTEGVQIEEAWKCTMCEYGNLCEWRKKKSVDCLQKQLYKV